MEQDCVSAGGFWGGLFTDCTDADDNGTADVCEGCPNLISAASVGAHDGVDFELAIDLAKGLIEPRFQGNNELWIKLEFSDFANVDDWTVTSSVAAHLEQNGSGLKIIFDELLPKGEVDLSISCGGVETVIPYCYVVGDVDCSGNTTGLDVAEISAPANWFKTVYEADPRADVDRNGSVTGLDVAIVSAPANWFLPDPPAPCGCP